LTFRLLFRLQQPIRSRSSPLKREGWFGIIFLAGQGRASAPLENEKRSSKWEKGQITTSLCITWIFANGVPPRAREPRFLSPFLPPSNLKFKNTTNGRCGGCFRGSGFSSVIWVPRSSAVRYWLYNIEHALDGRFPAAKCFFYALLVNE
jgi:hypothetical protein